MNGSVAVLRRRDGDRPVVFVRLVGEFDVARWKLLRRVLSECMVAGQTTVLDLSGVTFLDTLCVRELALHSQLYGNLLTQDPSPEAELSVAACELGDWIPFARTAGSLASHNT